MQAKSITIYGIKNCDTMKKARGWLDSHGVAYGFHDYKTAGITKDKLKGWSDKLGWETLLNRAGTTFRKLPDADREGLNERKALALMLAQPSMIKRSRRQIAGRFQAGNLCQGAAGQIRARQILERFRAKACPGLDPGWLPVRVKKTRQINNLEPRFDSIETGL
jgi:arsenate reductase